MKNILEEFWVENQRKIIWRQFVPYLCYLITSVWFMVLALQEREADENMPGGLIFILGIIILVQWLFQAYNELR